VIVDAQPNPPDVVLYKVEPSSIVSALGDEVVVFYNIGELVQVVGHNQKLESILEVLEETPRIHFQR
jgi:hypothetical protein